MIRPAPAYSPPPDTGLDIRHVDADLLIVDKPSGLLSVPGRGPGMDDNLASRVQARFPEALTVHRLDMDTSGLLVMARNPAGASGAWPPVRTASGGQRNMSPWSPAGWPTASAASTCR